MDSIFGNFCEVIGKFRPQMFTFNWNSGSSMAERLRLVRKHKYWKEIKI